LEEASVGDVSTIGLDLAKEVFQAHGADASGATLGLMLNIAPTAMAHFYPKTADLKLLAVYVLGALIGMSACIRH